MGSPLLPAITTNGAAKGAADSILDVAERAGTPGFVGEHETGQAVQRPLRMGPRAAGRPALHRAVDQSACRRHPGGISAGSAEPSASSVTTMSPDATAKPQAMALPLPYRVWRTTTTPGRSSRASRTVSSVEFPSTRIISASTGSRPNTSRRFRASLSVGITTLTDDESPEPDKDAPWTDLDGRWTTVEFRPAELPTTRSSRAVTLNNGC